MAMYFKIYADFSGANQNSHTWVCVYDPIESPYEPWSHNMHDISLDMEMGTAGTLTFTVEDTDPSDTAGTPPINPTGHPYYSQFTSLNSLLSATIRVDVSSEYGRDGICIWFGRITRIVKDFYGSATITCEGALAFLSDIYARPHHYSHYTYETLISDDVPIATLIGDEIGYVNALAARKRRFSITQAQIESAMLNSIYTLTSGLDDYKTYLDFFNDCVDLDKTTSLHWMPSVSNNIYFCNLYIINLASVAQSATTTGTIDIDLNLIDNSWEYSADDAATSIIPFGNNKIKITDDDYSYTFNVDGTVTSTIAHTGRSTDYVGSPTMYGKIEKIVDFDTDSPYDLGYKADTYINQSGSLVNQPNPKITLRAVDLAWVRDQGMIGINSIVNIAFDPDDGNNSSSRFSLYRCISCHFDIDNPDASDYTFVPADATGAAMYKKMQSLSRILSTVTRTIPDGVKDGNTGNSLEESAMPQSFEKRNEYTVDAIFADRKESYQLYKDDSSTEQVKKYVLKIDKITNSNNG